MNGRSLVLDAVKLLCYNIDMKILVIGDTHGKLNRVRDIWPKLQSIDLVIHTGDYYSDAKELSKELGVPFVFVRGNCDGSTGKESCDSQDGDFAVVETPAGQIFVSHGHRENVNYKLDTLRYKALENDCIAAVFGHTHRSMIEQAEDMWFINPGSLTLPRDGSGGSYAIIRSTEENFDATVVYYNTVMNHNKGGSSFGGHGGSGGNSDDASKSSRISSILNYIDRF